MPIEITIPRLGWSMDEGTFGEWAKQDGEYIAAGDPIFLLETEKALQEVESVDAGFLYILPDAVKEGDTVKVGTLIGFLLEQGEAPPKLEDISRQPVLDTVPSQSRQSDVSIHTSGSESKLPSSAVDSSSAASPSVRRLARELGVPLASLNLPGTISEHDVRRAAQGVAALRASAGPVSGTGQIPHRNSHPSLPRISPRAARAAKRFRIDWTTLVGSGQNGRIREQDVLAASGNTDLPDGTMVPATTMRKLIAERLSQSLQTTVPVTLTTVVCVDTILSDRKQRKEQTGVTDVVPAIHDYIMLAVAKTLYQFPSLNSRWMNGEILVPNGIHIGLAVDTDNGLSVPVVRDADQNSLTELTIASAELIARARDRKLTTRECSGGTFTISNLGSFGIDAFTPIINLGESAILGIGAIRKSPESADDGSIRWIQQMTLSLTFDHQVVDGAPAAKFLQHVCHLVESQAP